ncbi:MAG TPA: DUF1254 domain-containing protein [Hyphomicrobiaceae bacterium]|nr:DUF1254 domain-containing protein [Hyphomicrobiaceae bacterium]
MRHLRLLLARWPYLLAMLLAAAIVHILTTFLMPHLAVGDAYTRLSRSLPANTFVIFPPTRAGAQVLPYQAPDVRYAICRFDTAAGPVVVSVILQDVGWTLSLYSASGESFYAVPAAAGRTVDVRVLVLPPGDNFLGYVPERREVNTSLTQLHAPTRAGLAVLRAPLKGRAFAAEIEQGLRRSTCRQQPY